MDEKETELTAELAFRLARMQAIVQACTEMGIEFAARKELHQYVDILHKHLSQDKKLAFSELLRTMWKIDDCMIEILERKIEETNAEKD